MTRRRESRGLKMWRQTEKTEERAGKDHYLATRWEKYISSKVCISFQDVGLKSAQARSRLCKAIEEIKFDEFRARRARNEQKPKFRDFTNINGPKIGRKEERIIVTIQYIMENV